MPGNPESALAEAARASRPAPPELPPDFNWFHSIGFPDGTATPGNKRFEVVHSLRAKRPLRDSRTIVHAWR